MANIAIVSALQKQEGNMAEELPHPSEQLCIDRRRLLKTSVAMTAASFAPIVVPSQIAPVVSAQSISTVSEPFFVKVCATTARRVIECRNRLRRDAGLPLLEVAKEWRRMKEQDDSQKFSDAFGRFAAKYSKSVWDEVLKPRREALGDPNWKPKYWSEGVGYQGEVFRILRERFAAERTLIKRD
jgi:hypothetical protein